MFVKASICFVGFLACAVSGRQINSDGLAMIKQFEGFRANFYLDQVGVKTIGYGHACHVGDKCASIKAPISESQASQLLIKDLTSYGACVDAIAKVNDNQYAGLTSFAFNLGCEALKGSTLAMKLKAGDTKGASLEFGKWIYASGKVLPGLKTRREAERALFCKSGGC